MLSARRMQNYACVSLRSALLPPQHWQICIGQFHGEHSSGKPNSEATGAAECSRAVQNDARRIGAREICQRSCGIALLAAFNECRTRKKSNHRDTKGTEKE